MKKGAKPSRYGINGAVMDNPAMSDELRAEYENPDNGGRWQSGPWPNSAAALFAVGAFLIGLAWGQSGALELPVAPFAYLLIGLPCTIAAHLIRRQWEKRQKAEK